MFIAQHVFDVNAKMKISTKPSHSSYRNALPLFWKIGRTSELRGNTIKKLVFRDYPVALYRGNDGTPIAISDICIHRGASLSQGKITPNYCLQCPYHGWEFINGLVDTIPGCPEITPHMFGVPRFETCEVNNDIYMRPSYDINSEKGNSAPHQVYIPPESSDPNFVRISGTRKLQRPSSLITENVLDMLHVSYVHSFGNSLAPIPFQIQYDDTGIYSGRTTFHYTAGPTSISSVIGGAKYVTVENEFHLPDMTVTRVRASDTIIKTIVTHCYPIGKNESILHYDLYRNFFTSSLYDPLFQYQMDLTLKEDIAILSRVYDKYMMGFMNTKFDVTQVKYREKKRKLRKEYEIE